MSLWTYDMDLIYVLYDRSLKAGQRSRIWQCISTHSISVEEGRTILKGVHEVSPNRTGGLSHLVHAFRS